jgi:hypothetical protein
VNANGNFILGIDPGYSGAAAWYNIRDKRIEKMMPMPLKPIGGVLTTETRNEIDVKKFATVVNPLEIRFCVTERVNASPQMGVVSAFRFGEGFGQICGVLAANGIDARLVYPAVWKTSMNLSKDKSASVVLASSVFPEWAKTFAAGKKSADLAEAALLALYGTRFL